MSRFDEAASKADAVIFDEFADSATYDGATPCRVIDSRDMVVLEGEESRSFHNEITLAFLASEVSPERGKTVQIGAKTYRLGKQISNDGSVIQHLVEK